MDAWACKRSWTNPLSIGYEVKVSRSDFLRDDKWRAYLPLCHQFYFVCPTELIDRKEVPKNVGLIYVTSGGGRLITKIKSPFRNIELPNALLFYLLICRAKIQRYESNPEDVTVRWKNWLSRRIEDRELGYEVSRAIREKVDLIQRENARLKTKHREYDEVRAMLKTLGFENPDQRWLDAWNVKSKVQEMLRVVPPDLLAALKQVKIAAGEAWDKLNQLDQPKEQTDAKQG
jgi:hypothetical protein